jgi:hypothetical protein
MKRIENESERRECASKQNTLLSPIEMNVFDFFFFFSSSSLEKLCTQDEEKRLMMMMCSFSVLDSILRFYRKRKKNPIHSLQL